MSERYTMAQIKRMNIIERGTIIGYDASILEREGITTEEIYEIANGYKTLQEVYGPTPSFTPRHFSKEQLEKIDKRMNPDLQALLQWMAIIGAVIFGVYKLLEYYRFDWTVLLGGIIIAALYIIIRGKLSANR